MIAHYHRLDGKGGFMVEDVPEDPEKGFELALPFGRWLEFEVFPIATMEDAFPVIQRLRVTK